MDVTHKQLISHLDACYNATPTAPIYIWGPTGVGKSEVVSGQATKWANEEGRTLLVWNEASKDWKIRALQDPSDYFIFADIRLSQYDPSDIKGIPKLVSSLDASEWHIPMLFKAIGNDTARGVVFFDEMNLAPASILSSCYAIIHDRQVGESPINNKILLLGAGNRAEDRANVFDMPAPLKNRFGHVTLSPPSIDAWRMWAVDNDIDTRIIAFLSFKATMLHNFNKNQKAPAFPTPRAWAATSRLIKKVTKNREAKDLVHMIVGEGAAVEFHTYLELTKKIDINEIIDNPSLVKKITNNEASLKWAVVTTLGEMYRRTKSRKELPRIVKGICGVAAELDEEFGILMLRLVGQYKKRWLADFHDVDGFEPLAKKFLPLLKQKEE